MMKTPRPPQYRPWSNSIYNYSGDTNPAMTQFNPMNALPKRGPNHKEYLLYGPADIREKRRREYLGVVNTDLERVAYYSANNRPMPGLDSYYRPIQERTLYGKPNYIAQANTTTIYPNINTGEVQAKINFV